MYLYNTIYLYILISCLWVAIFFFCLLDAYQLLHLYYKKTFQCQVRIIFIQIYYSVLYMIDLNSIKFIIEIFL